MGDGGRAQAIGSAVGGGSILAGSAIASTASGLGLGTLSLSALGGPLGLAIAGGGIAGALVASQFGKGRKKANEWNSTIQDPFGARIKAIFDPVTEARKAGTLTYDDASMALDKFNAEVADIGMAQQSFEALGGDYATVAQQSRTKLDPLIAQWRTDLQAHVDAMKPPTTPDLQPKDAPSLDTILGETTPAEAAGRAALRQRKQGLGGGRQSTILAGRVPLAVPGRRPSLTGY
jgi:hypothetical protein